MKRIFSVYILFFSLGLMAAEQLPMPCLEWQDGVPIGLLFHIDTEDGLECYTLVNKTTQFTNESSAFQTINHESIEKVLELQSLIQAGHPTSLLRVLFEQRKMYAEYKKQSLSEYYNMEPGCSLPVTDIDIIQKATLSVHYFNMGNKKEALDELADLLYRRDISCTKDTKFLILSLLGEGSRIIQAIS